MRFVIYLAVIFVYNIAEDALPSWGDSEVFFYKGLDGNPSSECGFYILFFLVYVFNF
jgi:hypothetical protein